MNHELGSRPRPGLGRQVLEAGLALLLVLTLALVAFQHQIFGRDVVMTSRDAGAHIHAGYADDADGGRSRFIASSDPMRWTCDIQAGAGSLFCGKDMIFNKTGQARGIDLRSLESLTLVLDYRGPSETLRLHLKNFDPRDGLGGPGGPKPNKVEFSVRQGRQTIVLRPTDFSVADWWLAGRHFTPAMSRTQLDNVVSVDIATGTDPKPGLHAISVESLTFRRSAIAPAQLYLAIMGVWAFLIGGYMALRIRWGRQDALAKDQAQAEAREALAAAATAAQQANQAKSDFLANVSHEIRTPLNAIVGYAQLLEREGVEDRHRKAVQTIHRCGEHVVALISDLLDLSKVEAGKMELHPAAFDLGSSIETIVNVIQVRANEKGVAFVSELGPDLPDLVVADEKKLRQILLNLLSNAIKFTEEGSVTLRTTRLDGDPGQAALRFEVTDTGAGIDTDDLDRLFRPFEQVGEGHKQEGSTGLGLSITQALAGLMGTEILVESQIGHGSRFWFDVAFPLESGCGLDVATPDAVAMQAVVPLDRPLRVLAADDALANQQILRAMLEPAGLEVQIVSDGHEVCEAFKSGVYDLVLMDAQMPRMNGVSAARTIRAWEADVGRIRTPILALTGDVMAEHIARYRAAGMDGYISKPIQIDELFVAIQNVLNDPDERRMVQAG